MFDFQSALTPDRVNALFEATGAVLVIISLFELAESTGRVQGVSPFQIVFSGVWALWCIPYYVSVNHRLSLLACSFRAAAALAWAAVWLVIYSGE